VCSGYREGRFGYPETGEERHIRYRDRTGKRMSGGLRPFSIPQSGLYNPPLPHIWYMCEGILRGVSILPFSRCLFCGVCPV